MKPTFSATYPKDNSAPETNEDYLVCDRLRDVYGMSDGASESYDSKNWARVLVEKYIKSTRVSPSWLLKTIATYRASVNYDELSWSHQAAFERGSFATLLGAQLIGHGRYIRVTSVGDSLCVLCDGDRFAHSFRYSRPDEFLARPQLLASDIRLNQATLSSLRTNRFKKTWSTVDLTRPALLLMTDALGEWVLKDRDRRCERLLSLRHDSQFVNLVRSERLANKLRSDDTTLLVLN